MKSVIPLKSQYFLARAVLLIVASVLLVVGGLFTLSHQIEHLAAHDDGCLLCHSLANSKVALSAVTAITLNPPQLIEFFIRPLGFTLPNLEIELAFWGRAPPFFF